MRQWMRRAGALIALAAMLLSGSAHAQELATRSCDSAEYRQMDFLVGRWSAAYVRAPDQSIGVDVYELAHGGCVVVEHWTGADDQSGVGLNAYDRATGAWRHVWTDATGQWVDLVGGWRNGMMRFQGRTTGASGEVAYSRLDIEPLADGAVRQTYSSSADGETWAVRYRILLTRA